MYVFIEALQQTETYTYHYEQVLRMAEYILKNKVRLSELLQKASLSSFSDLSESNSTEELKINIGKHRNCDVSFTQLSKFFILNYIYRYANKPINNYDSSITEEITELLGSNPAHESINVQRNSGLKFPFKIWTKRTGIIQLLIIGIWLSFLIYLHFRFPELWIFTFHLPISGILVWISPRFIGQEKFENINSLVELVDEVYFLNKGKIESDNFSYLSEEIKKYVNEESS